MNGDKRIEEPVLHYKYTTKWTQIQLEYGNMYGNVIDQGRAIEKKTKTNLVTEELSSDCNMHQKRLGSWNKSTKPNNCTILNGKMLSESSALQLLTLVSKHRFF